MEAELVRTPSCQLKIPDSGLDERYPKMPTLNKKPTSEICSNVSAASNEPSFRNYMEVKKSNSSLDSKEGHDGPVMQDALVMGFPTSILDGPDVDKGWAWVSLLASFINMILIGMCMPMVGIFYIHHLETFEQSTALTACVGSLLIGLMSMLGPIAGWVCTRFGRRFSIILGGVLVCVSLAISSQSYNFWLVFVTNGFTAGIGLGLVTTPTNINIACYFVRKRTLASGMSLVGFPVGIFLSPPLLQYLEAIYGWRGALLIFAGLHLNLCAMGLIMVPSPLEKWRSTQASEIAGISLDKTADTEELLPNVEVSVYKNVSYYFIVLSFLFANFSINVIYVHLPRYLYFRGGTDTDVRVIYLLMGVSGAASKLLTGLGTGNVKNSLNLDTICLLIGSFSIIGCVLLAFPSFALIREYRLLCFFIVGFYFNVAPPTYVPISIETAGFHNLNDALGLIYLGVGIGYFSGPPVAAYIARQTNNLDDIFYCAGGVNFLAVVSLLVMVVIRKPAITKKENKEAI